MLRWFDGFETEKTGQVSRKWTLLSGLEPNINDTAGTWQGVGDYANDSGGGNGAVMSTPVFTSQDTWIFGAAIRLGGSLFTTLTDPPGIYLADSSGEQLGVFILDDNEGYGNFMRFEVRRGATVLATSARRHVDTWYYIEFEATVDTGVGGSFELRIHYFEGGALLTETLSDTGINTANQGVSGADRMVVKFDSNTSQAVVYLDDVYLCDDTGSKNNTFLGPQLVLGLQPDGDGNSLDWVLAGGAADLQQAWEETTVSGTDDDRRVTSDTPNDQSLATYDSMAAAAVPYLEGAITGVSVSTTAKMDSSGSRTIGHRHRKTTGTPAETTGITFLVDTTTFAMFTEVLEDDPNTATDWVYADIEGMEVGVRLIS